MSIKFYGLFAAALVALSLFFEYHQTTQLSPCSSHTWRQADAAAIAANYYRDDLKFFKPRIYNRQTGGDGYTAGEFTGTYWLAALCYKINGGINDAFLRGIHLLIFLGGLFGLLHITYHFLKEKWLAFSLPLLLFSAPVLTFYGNNFLPDAPALGFLLMAWATFLKHLSSRSNKYFWWSIILFSLAGLMKITMLMSLIALCLVFLLEWLGWVKFGVKKIFPKPLKAILGFGLVFGIVGAWYVYLSWYKNHHGNDYFFASLKAIWSGEDMKLLVYTLYRTLFFWSKYYFFPLVHVILFPLIFVVLLGKKSPGNLLYALNFFSFFGAIGIYLMWFYQFIDHDYYIISLYISPIFLLLSGLVILKKHYPNIFHSASFKVIFVAFLCLNIVYAKMTINQRYGGKLDYRINAQLAEPQLHSYLNELGIHKDAWVISLPDGSPNATLHLLNRPGFSEWIDRTGSRPNADVIRDWQGRGARYLIINQKDYLEKPAVQPFLSKKIGTYKDISIFDLSK